MRRDGFTLVELLVVLAIAGLVIGVAAPIVARGFPSVELASAAQSVEITLRTARGGAISRNREVVFTLDVESRDYGTDLDARVQSLSEDIAVRLVVGDREVAGEGVGGIRFFPDGSATGGRIELTLEGRRRAIDVDWLTGRIRTLEPEDDE